MLFDGFTVLAQIANFLILLWLMKRFLYQPVLDAIDAREKRISDLLLQTQQHEQRVEEQQSALAAKNVHFDAEREALLRQAKTDAQAMKQQMLERAFHEVAGQRGQWLSDLQKEQQSLDHEMSQRIQQEVFHIARKTLQDLSEVELESRVTQVFIRKLQQLAPQQCAALLGAGRQHVAHTALVIRSAMPLSEASQQALKEAVNETLPAPVTLQFEVDATQVSGIELLGQGQTLSWNIDDYLSGLQAGIRDMLNDKVTQVPESRQRFVQGEARD